MTRTRTWLSLLALALTTLLSASDVDPGRVRAVATKMFCNCGCSEILNECSHRECDRKDALKKEIAAAVLEGKSDDAILDAMGAKYGATILTVPSFQGFNMLLWIVPVGAAAIAVIAMIWRRWSWRTSRQETQG
jgi:cytochrome c-type biogenesis protein CcmH/NrfF